MARKGRTKGRAASRAGRTSDASGSTGRSRPHAPAASEKPSPRPTRDPNENEPFPPHARLAPEAFDALWRSSETSRSRGAEFGAEEISALRPHVINLAQGRFSDRGTFTSTAEDVRAIFTEHLPRWLAEGKRPRRIVFFAHGGLVPERTGLGVALRQRSWWLANDVYPIHFVWETGFGETIGQLIRSGGKRSARDFAEWSSDPVIETVAHFAGGPLIWGGMKRSAERAFEGEGGGRFALLRTLDLLRGAVAGIELHLVGHSAGSIFLAHLIETAVSLGLPAFRTVSLLAPAITIDEFRSRFMPYAGSGFTNLALFTMKRDLERADHCEHVYRKSLLYLIRNGLEPEVPTELLGLEESIRRTPDVAAFFGLAGHESARSGARRSRSATSAAGAEVIWSTTDATDGPGASRSTAHGGFDDDGPTMNSVLRRVLDRPSDTIVGFPEDAGVGARGRGVEERTQRAEIDARIRAELDVRGIDPDLYRGGGADDLDAHVFDAGGATVTSTDVDGFEEAPDVDRPDRRGPNPESVESEVADGAPLAGGAGAPGRRIALCIGIDEYHDRPLAGCVADATKWHELLGRLGFDCLPLMIDRAATRDAIMTALESLFRDARPGDVIAVQYSGHGAQVRDVDGDELVGDAPGAGAMPGDEPGLDEALVPFDYQGGAYVIDDDFAELFSMVGPGVNVTCFFDCCHSGTMNRLWPSRTHLESDPTLRPRWMRLTDAQQKAHLAFRSRLAHSRGGDRDRVVHAARGVHAAAEVFFSACRADELAWESRGQGEFTRRALGVLGSGLEGLTNEEFHRRVVEAFGSVRRQTPELHCADDRRRLPLLGARMGGGTVGERAARPPAAGGSLSRGDRVAIAKSLEAIARRLV